FRATPASRPASVQRLDVGGAADLAHVALDRRGTALDVGPRPGGAVAPRAGEHRGQARTLGVGQRRRVAAEEAARRGLRAVHAVAELGHVGVDLQDPALGPQQFQQHGVPGLQALAHPARGGARPLPEEQVLGHLLADGAAAAQPAAPRVAFARLADGLEVEARMGGEVLVLGGDQRHRQAGRHRVEVAPVVGDAEIALPGAPGVDLPDRHERGERRIDEPQHQHLHHAGQQQPRRQPQQPAPPAPAASAPGRRRPGLRHHHHVPICHWRRRWRFPIRPRPARARDHAMTEPNPSGSDRLTRFLLPGAGVRGVHVRLERSWQRIRSNDDYPTAIAELLGEAVVASALFTGHVKVDGRLSIQFGGEGALRTLFAECTASGTLRGIARLAEDAPAPPSRDLRQLGKDAVLAITIENPGLSARDPVRYQGLVPLEADSLAGAFEDYFRRSEQLPTRLLLAAAGNRAAGLMLQKLPGDEGDADGWTRAGALFDTLQAGELLELPAADVLRRLFHEEGVETVGGRDLAFGCSCSRERVAAMLGALGADEARAAVIDGAARVRCEFCGERYAFDQAQVEALLAEEAPT